MTDMIGSFKLYSMKHNPRDEACSDFNENTQSWFSSPFMALDDEQARIAVMTAVAEILRDECSHSGSADELLDHLKGNRDEVYFVGEFDYRTGLLSSIENPVFVMNVTDILEDVKKEV